jgi:anaerobic magnesium-protoporphyrin IX monomethyl ester cyclase
MNINCILISPPYNYKTGSIYQEVTVNDPPLGLAYIAGFARSKGHTVRIIDCNVEAPSIDEFRDLILNEFIKCNINARIIGVTTTTPSINSAHKVAAICKKYFNECRVVFGGPHATFQYSDILEDDCVDIVVCGEGEVTFEELLSNKKPLNEIEGIVYREGGNDFKKIVKNKPRERIKDLDNLPMPAYDLLSLDKYHPALGAYKEEQTINMSSTRGCPEKCSFCAKVFGSFLTYKSYNKIFEELCYLKNVYKINHFLFFDESFTINRNNVLNLCNLIIENKLAIEWTCFARADLVDLTLLRIMREAGCYQIMYGAESFNKIVLNNISKHLSSEIIFKAVQLTKSVGIECRLAMMVGNPGDTEQNINDNIKILKKLNPDLIVVNIAVPFPGTALYRWANEENRILSFSWDDYTGAIPLIHYDDFSEKQILYFYKKMYRDFYLRIPYILKMISRVNSRKDVLRLLYGFKSLLSFLLNKKLI